MSIVFINNERLASLKCIKQYRNIARMYLSVHFVRFSFYFTHRMGRSRVSSVEI